MTDTARILIVGKLEKLKAAGHQPQAVLEQSIVNSWQGVFELRGNRNGYNKAQQRQDSNLAEREIARAAILGGGT